MKLSIYVLLTVLFGLFMAACSEGLTGLPPNLHADQTQVAQQALTDFLENLNNERYTDAIGLYGGSYEIMIDHNPGIDPSNHAALIQNACRINGAQCLEVKSVALEKKVSDTDFEFRVEFLNIDGTLFVLGPCCGGNETDTPPQSSFIFEVVKGNYGKFVVTNMPPYMP